MQVKTATHRDGKGRWVVVIARRPYLREATGGREPYDYEDVDAFFVINGIGECYLIPIARVAGRISITLDRYRTYYLGSIGGMFNAEGVDSVWVPGRHER